MKLTKTNLANIHLTTFIQAPVERVFDLSRHIDLQKKVVTRHQEEPVAGTRFGLIGKDETVTWKARHLFKTRLLRSRVTEMSRPFVFVDEQSPGERPMVKHEHHFKACNNGTIMIDLIHFETRFGLLGKIFNAFYLSSYVREWIEQRNRAIKEYAETEKWKNLLAN